MVQVGVGGEATGGGRPLGRFPLKLDSENGFMVKGTLKVPGSTWNYGLREEP